MDWYEYDKGCHMMNIIKKWFVVKRADHYQRSIVNRLHAVDNVFIHGLVIGKFIVMRRMQNLPPETNKDIKIALRKISYAIHKIKEKGLSHGDIHWGNILYNEGKIIIIDPSPIGDDVSGYHMLHLSLLHRIGVKKLTLDWHQAIEDYPAWFARIVRKRLKS